MWDDIWKILLVCAHFAVIYVLFAAYGVPGTLLGIATVACFWVLKNGMWPDLKIWPDNRQGRVEWPKPLRAAGSALVSLIGYTFMLAMGLGVLASIGSLGTCSSSSDYGDVEYRAR
jgi:hypothetical protein